MEKGRVLQIFRDGRRNERKTLLQLPTGAQANLQTLAVMKQIVREDARQPDLRNFANQVIFGGKNHSLRQQIDTAFDFARDEIVYDGEKDGFETVADLWSCMFALHPDHPQGDCAIKCVALATLLSFLDLQPAFVAIQQIPDATFFNHVYISVAIDGKQTPLDPTPPEFRIGDELTSYSKLYYRIF